jgi:hypothetical protein
LIPLFFSLLAKDLTLSLEGGMPIRLGNLSKFVTGTISSKIEVIFPGENINLKIGAAYTAGDGDTFAAATTPIAAEVSILQAGIGLEMRSYLLSRFDSLFQEEVSSSLFYTSLSLDNKGHPGLGINASYNISWSLGNIALGLNASYNLAYTKPYNLYWPSIGLTARLNF